MRTSLLRNLTLVLALVAIFAGSSPLLAAEPGGGGCPTGKPGCVCPQNYDPVVCPDGCRYSNACAASCAGQRDCVRPGKDSIQSSQVPLAPAGCPPAVAAAVQKAHAGAAIASCKQERDNGKTQFEVTLAPTDGRRMSLDVTPDGTIVLTEQSLAVSDVPPAVMKAFAAKYGAAKPTRAEMQTTADGRVSFEIAFAAGTKKKEATFASDGTFIEEE